MWDRDHEDEVLIGANETCFREAEALQTDHDRQQTAELQYAIVEGQKKLRALREKEDAHDARIKALRSELHRAREGGVDDQHGLVVDVGILLDSEDNMQWFKRRAPEIIESLTTLRRNQHTVRCGVVFYGKSNAGDCRLIQFTDEFQRLLQDPPPAPKDPTGLKGAIGEAINLLQWQGTARILLHPSPSSTIRKGQDPPTSQNTHFFPRFGTNSDTNVELQRAVLALRALFIDYFIVKTGSKVDASQKVHKKKGDGKLTVAISHYFDDPESFLEARFMKIEEAHNIKKAILSCIGMAMRS